MKLSDYVWHQSKRGRMFHAYPKESIEDRETLFANEEYWEESECSRNTLSLKLLVPSDCTTYDKIPEGKMCRSCARAMIGGESDYLDTLEERDALEDSAGHFRPDFYWWPGVGHIKLKTHADYLGYQERHKKSIFSQTPVDTGALKESLIQKEESEFQNTICQAVEQNQETVHFGERIPDFGLKAPWYKRLWNATSDENISDYFGVKMWVYYSTLAFITTLITVAFAIPPSIPFLWVLWAVFTVWLIWNAVDAYQEDR